MMEASSNNFLINGRKLILKITYKTLKGRIEAPHHDTGKTKE